MVPDLRKVVTHTEEVHIEGPRRGPASPSAGNCRRVDQPMGRPWVR